MSASHCSSPRHQGLESFAAPRAHSATWAPKVILQERTEGRAAHCLPLAGLLFFFLCCLPLATYAGDDFGIWSEATLQKDLTKKLSIDASLGFRAEEKLQRVARWDLAASLSYKPLRFLTLGASYTFIYGRAEQSAAVNYKSKTDESGNLVENGYNVDHGFWRSRHRASFDVTGKLKVGRFEFSLRERYQFTHYVATTTTRDRYRDELPSSMLNAYTGEIWTYNGQAFTEFEQASRSKAAKDKHFLRSRLQGEYHIRRCPLTPFASIEFHNDLSDGFALDKSRLMVGTEWKVAKKHRLDLAYVFQHAQDDDAEGNLHAISIGYKFKF